MIRRQKEERRFFFLVTLEVNLHIVSGDQCMRPILYKITAWLISLSEQKPKKYIKIEEKKSYDRLHANELTQHEDFAANEQCSGLLF